MSTPTRVLFICTGNCCRSQMAEALLRHLGGDRFITHSAGSDPAGYIHPLATETMAAMGVSTEGQRSKSWDEFTDEPHEIILTLCDSAAAEACPTWPGQPATAHWGLPDPSFAPGPDDQRLAAAMGVAGRLRARIEQLVALPLDDLTPDQLRAELHRIAQD